MLNIKVAKYFEDKYDIEMLSTHLDYINKRLEELSEDNNNAGAPSTERIQLRWIKRIIEMIGEYGIESIEHNYYKSVIKDLHKNGETEEIRSMASNVIRLLKYDESKWENKVASIF